MSDLRVEIAKTHGIDADQIVVIDAGRVLDSGTHDTLLQTSPLYQRLWERLSTGRTLDEHALFHGQAENTIG